MRNKVLGTTAAVVIVGALAGTAQADVEMQTMDFAFPLSPGFVELDFDQFDTQGGLRVLKSVELIVDGTAGADVTVENLGDIPTPGYTVTLDALLSVQFASLESIVGLNESQDTGPLAAFDGVVGSGPDFFDFGFFSASGMESDLENDPTEFSQYEGTGTITATIFGSGEFSLAGTTDSDFSVDNFGASGTVTIIYNFNVIPAPPAVAAADDHGCPAFGHAGSGTGQKWTIWKDRETEVSRSFLYLVDAVP